MSAENSQGLSQEDIDRLQGYDVSQRRQFAKQLAHTYVTVPTPENYRQMAEDIFRVIAEDMALEVRKAFAEIIKNSRDVPSDIVHRIAQDVEEVALPVIACSEALKEETILGLIENDSGNEAKLGAIAGRHDVTEKVSEALIDTKIETVVSVLLENSRAEISDSGYSKIVDTFHENGEIIQNLMNRDSLSVNVVNNIAENVSAHILKNVSTRDKAVAEAIKKAAKKAEEVVSMKVIGLESSAMDYNTFMDKMAAMGVTDEIIPIAALSLGKMNFFESYVARRMRIPVANVRTLVSDVSNKGFRAVYVKMKLPERLYAATALLVSVLRDLHSETETDISTINVEMTNRIIEEMNCRAEESEDDIDNVDYICGLIKHSQRLFAPK